jgi:phytoene dehydrogenase-like protein
LGLKFSGAFPKPGRASVTLGPKSYPLPASFASLVTSRFLTVREKWRLFKFFRDVPKMELRWLDWLTIGDWVREYAGDGNLAKLLHTLFRLTTYANDPQHVSAGAVLEQFRLGLRGNVWYLDGGWQTMIDGLRSYVEDHNGRVHTEARVEQVREQADGVEIQFAGADTVRAGAAVLAVEPATACRVLALDEQHALSRWSREARPARNACLDVALTKLPRPLDGFALGLDRPNYFSVHSNSAQLGPEGIAVVHLMKYLGPHHPESNAAVEVELEAYLDQIQPGWRAFVHTRRFLPNMVVTHGAPLAAQGGLAGRPSVEVADRPHAFLAGDWVGNSSQLADASTASGARAAELALSTLATRNERRLANARN